jgi:hypothetical protein
LPPLYPVAPGCQTDKSGGRGWWWITLQSNSP